VEVAAPAVLEEAVEDRAADPDPLDHRIDRQLLITVAPGDFEGRPPEDRPQLLVADALLAQVGQLARGREEARVARVRLVVAMVHWLSADRARVPCTRDLFQKS